MASPKVFITGITGYIGGDAFADLYLAHPEWSFTALVRNSDKGARVAAKCPKTRLVYGTLDDVALIEKESADADIVLNFANADHAAGAKAIIAGLASGEKAGYYIHVSGTGVLIWPDLDEQTLGEARNKVWDDVADIAEINAIPNHSPHRKIDQIVIEANSFPNVNTAIVCPPTIYGPGRGSDNTRSIQIPGLVKSTLQRGKGYQVGEGLNMWSEVHVQDLSKIFLKLAESAAAGGKGATWGSEGYYFAENGDFVWGDMAKEITKQAHKLGLLQSDEVDSLPPAEVDKLVPHGSILVGTNSRSRASRARKDLGWKPEQPSLLSLIKEHVEAEKAQL